MLEHSWYRSNLTALTRALLPLAGLFGFLVSLRRFLYRIKLKKSYRAKVPVIIVGNITVGGTGKTPLVIWLADFLSSNGFKPGIVSRGCGGSEQKTPRFVTEKSDPSDVGDEALLLMKRTHCPVVVGVNRSQAVKILLAKTPCDIILSDDGLQHYALARDIEIAVIDGVRGLGNQKLLPAGPLREPASRLQEVDFIVRQGEAKPHEFSMELQGDYAVLVQDEAIKKPLTEFAHQAIHLLAGIGHPERFFSSLTQYQFQSIEHKFQDHYIFKKNDIYFKDQLPVLMTEKDAVKCKTFADSRHWYLPVVAKMDERFGVALMLVLANFSSQSRFHLQIQK